MLKGDTKQLKEREETNTAATIRETTKQMQ